jgi:hypothetical protein
LPEHSLGVRRRLDSQRLRGCGNALTHELQAPAEPYAYSAAAPAQGDSFQPPSFDHRPLLLRDDMICWDTDKGTSTGLARGVVFPRIEYARSASTASIPRGDLPLCCSELEVTQMRSASNVEEQDTGAPRPG